MCHVTPPSCVSCNAYRSIGHTRLHVPVRIMTRDNVRALLLLLLHVLPLLLHATHEIPHWATHARAPWQHCTGSLCAHKSAGAAATTRGGAAGMQPMRSHHGVVMRVTRLCCAPHLGGAVHTLCWLTPVQPQLLCVTLYLLVASCMSKERAAFGARPQPPLRNICRGIMCNVMP